MSQTELHLRCQRCGTEMQMRDPAPGTAWKPDQFWVCPQCGRHFWTTHAAPPKPAAEPGTPAGPAPGGPAAPKP